MSHLLSGPTTPVQSGPGSNDTYGVLCIPQSSNIIGALISDCLMPYYRTLVRKFFSSGEKQSLYFTADLD